MPGAAMNAPLALDLPQVMALRSTDAYLPRFSSVLSRYFGDREVEHAVDLGVFPDSPALRVGANGDFASTVGGIGFPHLLADFQYNVRAVHCPREVTSVVHDIAARGLQYESNARQFRNQSGGGSSMSLNALRSIGALDLNFTTVPELEVARMMSSFIVTNDELKDDLVVKIFGSNTFTTRLAEGTLALGGWRVVSRRCAVEAGIPAESHIYYFLGKYGFSMDYLTQNAVVFYDLHSTADYEITVPAQVAGAYSVEPVSGLRYMYSFLPRQVFYWALYGCMTSHHVWGGEAYQPLMYLGEGKRVDMVLFAAELWNAGKGGIVDVVRMCGWIAYMRLAMTQDMIRAIGLAPVAFPYASTVGPRRQEIAERARDMCAYNFIWNPTEARSIRYVPPEVWSYVGRPRVQPSAPYDTLTMVAGVAAYNEHAGVPPSVYTTANSTYVALDIAQTLVVSSVSGFLPMNASSVDSLSKTRKMLLQQKAGDKFVSAASTIHSLMPSPNGGLRVQSELL